MFDFFDELFAPGRKHTEDERNRLELTREDEGSSDPARGPIDLTSGTVTVRLPDKPNKPDGEGKADEPAEGGGEAAEAAGGAPATEPAPAPATTEPAPAPATTEDHDRPDAPAA
jgi:hypothetical protein